MKIRMICFVLLIVAPVVVLAQGDDLLDAFKKGAEQYNESEGDKTQNEANELSEADKEKQANWKKMFDENVESLKKGFDKFDIKETSCIFLMVVYLDSYFKLVDLVAATDDCRSKYDLYGMMAMAITMSTTIMYCPESLYNMSIDEREEVYRNDLVPILQNADGDSFVEAWIQKFEKVTSKDVNRLDKERFGGDMIYKICLFFSPDYIVSALLTINQQMEALGCGD